MLPKGGDAVWGQRNHPAPDFNETENTKVVLASLIVTFGGQVPAPTGWCLLQLSNDVVNVVGRTIC